MPKVSKAILILPLLLLVTSYMVFNFSDHFPPEKLSNSPANEAVLLNEQGTPRLFYVNRPGDADKIMSMRWTGEAWTEAREEFALPGQAYYALQMVENNKKDLISVFHIFAKGENGHRGRHLDLWVNRKTAGKWGKPFKIYDGYVGAIRGLIRLKSGRLLLAFSRAVPERENAPPTGEVDYGWNNIIAMYSDDGGKSWEKSINAIEIEIDNTKPTRYGGVEPELMELSNGKIRMLIRTTHGFLYQSYSGDGGISWEEPEPTRLISSDSPASVLRLKDGRLVVFLNSCQRWDNPNSYAIGGREVLHAAISSDDGNTWSGFREVAFESEEVPEKGDRGTAYPSAIEIEDGRILLVTGQGDSGGVYAINADWLEENSQVRYLSFKAGPRRPHDAKGKTALKSRGDTLVFSSFIKEDAVINFPSAKKGSIEIGPLPARELLDWSIALTDHFSVPSDTAAFAAGVFRFKVSEILKITDEKESVTLRLHWNLSDTANRLRVYIGREQLADFNSRDISSLGLNYLRVRSTNGFSKNSGVVPLVYKGY